MWESAALVGYIVLIGALLFGAKKLFGFIYPKHIDDKNTAYMVLALLVSMILMVVTGIGVSL